MRIFDLDNCISDDLWRLSLIRDDSNCLVQRYHVYHMLSLHDNPRNFGLWAFRNDTVIVTSRPERYRALTEAWLERYRIRHIDLIMRSDHDFRPTPAIKREAAQILLHGGHHIDAAFDDREDIVEQYKLLGINARVLAIHPVRQQWDMKAAKI